MLLTARPAKSHNSKCFRMIVNKDAPGYECVTQHFYSNNNFLSAKSKAFHWSMLVCFVSWCRWVGRDHLLNYRHPCEDCCKWPTGTYRKHCYATFPDLYLRKVDSILQEIDDRPVFTRSLRDDGNLAETPRFFLCKEWSFFFTHLFKRKKLYFR